MSLGVIGNMPFTFMRLSEPEKGEESVPVQWCSGVFTWFVFVIGGLEPNLL